MEKIITNVGVYGGIINSRTGLLLLHRRTEPGSIIPGKSYEGCYELPGCGVMDAEKIPYNHLLNELQRGIEEKIGIQIGIDPMAPVFPVLFKGPTGLFDLAVVTRIFEPQEEIPGTIWVSTEQLNKLAKEFVLANKEAKTAGAGLNSGYGKRMHCMALWALCGSHFPECAGLAEDTLAEIQRGW